MAASSDDVAKAVLAHVLLEARPLVENLRGVLESIFAQQPRAHPPHPELASAVDALAEHLAISEERFLEAIPEHARKRLKRPEPVSDKPPEAPKPIEKILVPIAAARDEDSESLLGGDGDDETDEGPQGMNPRNSQGGVPNTAQQQEGSQPHFARKAHQNQASGTRGEAEEDGLAPGQPAGDDAGKDRSGNSGAAMGPPGSSAMGSPSRLDSGESRVAHRGERMRSQLVLDFCRSPYPPNSYTVHFFFLGFV